jgi:tetratricopeptide (TPR) repeat protein
MGNNLSLLLLDRGRPKEALALLEELRADQKTAQAEGRRSPVYARTFANEAEVLIRMGQFERASGSARQAVAMMREQGAEAEQAAVLPVLARAQLGFGQLSEAQRTAQQAVEIHQRLAGAGHPPPPELQHVLGEVLLARGDAAGARAALGQALEAWEKAGANPAILAPVRFDLARALHLERMEPARVRALANAAREALAPTPEPRRVKLADIDAFLRRVNSLSSPRGRRRWRRPCRSCTARCPSA